MNITSSGSEPYKFKIFFVPAPEHTLFFLNKGMSTEVIVKRFYLNCLAQASFVIAHDDFAFVVDPRRDVSIYLQGCQSLGVKLGGILLTHLHADFVAGHSELSAIASVPIFAGERTGSKFTHYMVSDGDVLRLSGRYSMHPLATPGHTPGCITWTIVDREAPVEPPNSSTIHAFTGDTLFVSGIGRPDLIGSIGFSQHAMAEEMFDSLGKLLKKLPHDGCIVWPGHGAGSPCGKSLGSGISTTLATELGKKACGSPANPYLHLVAAGEKDAFIMLDLEGLPEPPAYFGGVVRLNMNGPDSLADVKERTMLLSPGAFVNAIQSPEELLKGVRPEVQEQASSAPQVLVVDTREWHAFAAGHIAGSWNLPIGLSGGEVDGPDEGNFGIWVGALVPPNAQLLVVAEPMQMNEAIERFARIGYEAAGILNGTMADCAIASSSLVQKMTNVKAADLAGIAGAGGMTVVDVRTGGEFSCPKNGHYKDAVNVPLSDIKRALTNGDLGAPEDIQTFAMYCKSGYRAAIASSIVRSSGRNAVSIIGGYDALTAVAPAPHQAGFACGGAAAE